VSLVHAFGAFDLEAVHNVLVVGRLVSSSSPIECHTARGIADAALAPGLEHRTVEHVSPGVVARLVVMSAVPAVERSIGVGIRRGGSS
jgi:hypothetical protein